MAVAVSVTASAADGARVAAAQLRNNTYTIETDRAAALAPAERAWADAVERELADWERGLPDLRRPFAFVAAPKMVRLRMLPGGERDAYTCGDSAICLDLGAWQKAYGEFPREKASAEEARSRIRRILSHEYTHLLTGALMRGERLPMDTPLRRTLWELYHEGFGNYRSLSEKWLPSEGKPSPAAQAALKRLTPVLLERLSAIARLPRGPESPEELRLREGLSEGPFDQKWGALPIALWLAEEASGDDLKLKHWADASSGGILPLIHRHLPPSLHLKLDALPSLLPGH